MSYEREKICGPEHKKAPEQKCNTKLARYAGALTIIRNMYLYELRKMGDYFCESGRVLGRYISVLINWEYE